MMRSLPTIKLEDFEGPFDLLIEMARKKKLDLSKVSLTKITDDFLELLKRQNYSEGLYADFMIVAATLLLLKIKHLLPDLTEEEEEEIADLTFRLQIYELYRQQATEIRSNWHMTRLLPAGYCKYLFPQEANPDKWPAYSPQDMSDFMKQVIQQIPSPAHPKAHFRIRGKSLQECTRIFQDRLQRVNECIFHEVISGSTKQDVAVAFLAVLEMSRTKAVSLYQNGLRDKIIIKKI